MKKVLFYGLLLFLFAGQQVLAQEKQLLTLEHANSYMFYPRQVRGLSSMNDGEHYSTLARGNKIEIYEYKSGNLVKTIETGITNPVSDYEFSPNEKLILLTTKAEQIYRHSFTAHYVIYDIEKKTAKVLSDNGAQQLATFSPDGKKIAFVRENNLFVKDLESREEHQLTKDGKFNYIINGAPDWVYEEEFGFSKAFAWSPDSKTLAYYRFDESNVKQFDMQMYDGLYPSVYRFKYPKAGEGNSTVSIHLYDMASTDVKKVDIGTETDIYIPRIKWTNDASTLAVARLNRLQNKLELLFADSKTGKTKVVYTEENKRYYDYEHLDRLDFLPDGKHFAITSEKDGFTHLYLFGMDGKQVRQLTQGAFDLMDYYGYNTQKKTFYVQAAAVSPMQREVYAVGFRGKKMERLTPENGTNSADFSANFNYFINSYSTANDPGASWLFSNKGKKLREVMNNSAVAARMEMFTWQKKEMFSFQTSEGVKLNGWMIKPYNFDANKKYPVFMYQYSGPNSQSVLDTYGGFTEWFQMLAQKGYIIACVDGRGTGARGEEFRKMTYLNLGKYETIDQIEAAKYLQAQPYVDKERIGIFGWSYGGYMSTLCLLKGNDVFKTAIAVAPVTNWRYYDNIYTERYMRRPQENADGYDKNSPMHFADQLKGNYLLIHGTGDDNVHVVNAIEMSKTLIKANKDFDYMLYPNENHGIRSSAAVRLHLMTKMTNFVLKKL